MSKIKTTYGLRSLILSILFLIAGCGGGAGGTGPSFPIYTAVIDAGSSGTRIFLYKVTPGVYPIVEKLIEKENNKAEDGINDFINNQGGISGNLGADQVGPFVIGPLLDAITPRLAEMGVRPKDVLIDLLATAGMRTEEIRYGGIHTDAEIAGFYKNIKNYIGEKGFSAGDVRTTDGNSEEGKWTWTNLNDKYNNIFITNNAPVGVIEVGGSSTQISYLTNAAPDSSKNIYLVAIGGKKYSVFSKTYLGLGQDDARKAMRTVGYPGAYTGGVDCYPSGMTTSEDGGDFNVRVSPLLVLPVVKLRSITGADSVARYDFIKCSSTFGNVIDAKLTKLGNPEILNSSGSFYGIDGAYYAFEAFGLQDTVFSTTQLAAKTQAMCNSKINFDLSKSYLQKQCPSATYINSLLYGPSGLFFNNPEKFSKVVPTKVSGDTVLTWTRGYLMNKYAL